MVLPAAALERARPDAAAFAEHFERGGEIVVFDNLGGDATLVVPAPRAQPQCYTHLAAFVRAAPAAQVRALWRAVASATIAAIGDRPRWLSTAGLGVFWLHVRLDSRPKYYRHDPYRR